MVLMVVDRGTVRKVIPTFSALNVLLKLTIQHECANTNASTDCAF